MRSVDTIHYFPPHIKSIEEFQRIAKAYDKELRLLWVALGAQVNNYYFDEMDEATCERWEKIIGIQNTGSETLFERRLAIKGKWTSGLPYTEPKFHEVLQSMVGDKYSLRIDVPGKTLDVGIMLAEVLKVQNIRDLIRAMAPADMDVIVRIVFNRWRRFTPLTWKTTWNDGADTWGDVKENSKWQEAEDE